jgi:hypothetical protein
MKDRAGLGFGFSSLSNARNRLIPSAIAAGILVFAAVAVASITSGDFKYAASSQVPTTNVTVTKPSSSARDVMIATIAIHGGSSAVVGTVPSGWHLIASTTNDASLTLLSYWKTDSGSEPSSYQWTIDNQTYGEGAITAYSGVDNSHPIDVSDAPGNPGLSTTATTSPITTTAANDTVISVFAVDEGKTGNAGSYFSTPTGMTLKYDVSNTPFGPSIAQFEKLQSTAGTFTSASSSISGGNKPKNWATQVIALKMIPPVTAPIAYWKFDESSGDAADATGNGNTMFNFGSTTFTSALINNGADLGSNNSTKAFANPSSLGFATGPFSAVVWAKMYATQGYSGNIMLYSACDNPIGTCMSIHINAGTWDGNSGTVQCDLNGDPSNDVQATVTLGTTAFHQFAWTFDGSTLTCYVDGTSIGSHSDSIESLYPNSNWDGTAIGALGGGASNTWNDLGEHFSAVVDEAGAWHHALSATEVSQLYNGGAGRTYPF